MMMQSGLPLEQKAAYLRTLPAIRERCGRVHDLAKAGKLQYFAYHPEKEVDAAEFCIELIRVSTANRTYTWMEFTVFGVFSESLAHRSTRCAVILAKWDPTY
jgi:hypothetical protein